MAKIDDSVKKKVPELRFKGFTDDWEERKLGDEVRIVMGQSPNSENYTDDPNDYILVQGNADMKNGRVLPRVWTTQVTKQAEKDDLILSVRAPVGDIGKTAYDVVIGRGVAAIKGNEFIFQNLGKMKSDGYWTRYSTGSTFESINSTDIKEAIISVPAIDKILEGSNLAAAEAVKDAEARANATDEDFNLEIEQVGKWSKKFKEALGED